VVTTSTATLTLCSGTVNHNRLPHNLGLIMFLIHSASECPAGCAAIGVVSILPHMRTFPKALSAFRNIVNARSDVSMSVIDSMTMSAPIPE